MAPGAESSLTEQHLTTVDLITDFLFEKCKNIKSHFWEKAQAEQHFMKMRMIRKPWHRLTIQDINQYSTTGIIESFQFYKKHRKPQKVSNPDHELQLFQLSLC